MPCDRDRPGRLVPPRSFVIRSRAAAFVVWCERLSRGRGYLLRCRPAAPAVHEGPLARSVAAVNAAIEKEVRRAPAQYLWSYKRFRFRPNGEISPYKIVR